MDDFTNEYLMEEDDEGNSSQQQHDDTDSMLVAVSSVVAMSTAAALLLLSRQQQAQQSTMPSNHRSLPRKQRTIYDRARARQCIWDDYLKDSARFNDMNFSSQFRVSRRRFESILQTIVAINPKFYTNNCDAAGNVGTSIEAKAMIALKALAYGASPSAWRDYFQMSVQLSNNCLTEFVKAVSAGFREEYLRLPSRRDAKNILKLHAHKHGVHGMLGSLDCMHIHWKNCPMAWQGTHKGKEKHSTIILEAACDYNLWIWHSFFGCPGAMNDINVLHLSPLFEAFLKGTFDVLDHPFQMDGQDFHRCYYLVDGIYPELSRFVKTIAAPIGRKESIYAGWQEATRKDIERCFGVLQCQFQVLSRPLMALNLDVIHNMVDCCSIMHNMIVQDRINGVDSIWYDASEGIYIGTPATAATIVNHPPDQRRQSACDASRRSRIGAMGGPPGNFVHIPLGWSKIANKKEHLRLRKALVNHVTSNNTN